MGLGSDRPLVTPDDTAAKKAKNRRYEIQVRL
jgi:outer membrane protein OmpA-like peptidoglycan-associated protein